MNKNLLKVVGIGLLTVAIYAVAIMLLMMGHGLLPGGAA